MTVSLEDYEEVVGKEVIDQLRELALPLKGMKIVHVNSTRVGGGVAEILTKMVPLMQALGIETSWEVINGNQEFFQCTKNFHNALQANQVIVPNSQLKAFEKVNAENAELLRPVLNDADFVFIHDPQPLPLLTHFPDRKGKWVWRCHIDASRPYRQVWNYLKQYMVKYDASVFSLAAFAHPLPHPMYLIPPSIDPLSPKNVQLSQEQLDSVYNEFNIDPERPMILQVSRYDRFKDPIGVIEAYRMAKRFQPKLQLVLAGGGATDDPEGEMVLNEVKLAAEDDDNIKVLLLPPDAHTTINALQRCSDIVLQKSVKEGFGLTVTEALWKGKPVIGGNVGGIKLQITNYQTGFLVNTPEGAAHGIRYLLQNKKRRQKMGEHGRQFVQEKFLITRHIREYLTLILTLMYETEDRIELKE